MFFASYVVICLIWMAFDLRLVLLKRAPASGADKGSLLFLSMSVAGGMAVGNVLGFLQVGPVITTISLVRWLGLLILVSGLVLRVVAMRTLGPAFTANVTTNSEQPLVTAGPYRVIRHPAYLGVLLCSLGMSIALGYWSTLLVAVVPVLAALVYRVRIEERALVDHFGEAYATYARRSYRLIPPFF